MAATSVTWIQIGIGDLQNARAGPLVLAMQQTALSTGQSDPTPDIIAEASDEVLGVIGFSGRYTMDAAYGTETPNRIPPNLKRLVVEKICRIFKGRLNMALLPQEVQDERDYQTRLRDIREGRWPIDLTDNPGNNLSRPEGAVTMTTTYQAIRFRTSQLNNL